jgi:hypothetical protein
MTSLVAAIRDSSFYFPLFLHIFGAMVLVGSVLTAVVAALGADRTGDAVRMRRLTFRTLLFVGLPAYIVMRIGAEWLYSKEFGDLPEEIDDPTWVGIGYITADLGALLFLIALVAAGVGSWKSQSWLGKAAGIVGAIALIGWIVAVWAMGAKPT